MVKLVEYPDSSEDERDAASDGSQWSSFGQVPSSPSDSFSYPMRSPESDEDEDYAPSETSLEPPDSDTQSVDTDDLDPHDEDTLDEEEDTLEQEEDTLGQEEDDSGGQKQDPDIIDLTQPKGGVSGWKELQEAFVDNPFKRRSVEKPAEANTFDVEAGRWSFQANDTEKTKKQLRRPSSAGQRQPTGVSPSSNPKSPTEANPSPFSTSNRGAAPATPIVGPPAQFLFGKGTSHDPFEFGDAAIDSQAERPSSQFAGTQTDNAAFGAFNIGNSGAKKNSRHTSRVRPRKSGMFTNKNSPRKDAKRGENEPEPSPGASASTSTSQSPFGMDNRRSRKNARLRHTYGRSPPADPFVTPTFHNHPSSSPFVSSEGNPDVVRPTANKGIPFTFGASATNFTAGTAQQPSTSNEPGVPFFRSQQQQATVSQSQDSSHSIPQSNGSVHHDKPQPSNEGGTRPAFAGSRRILRAALRGAGVRNDRVSSAPPATTGYHREEGDADMDSEDEHDWLELKLLGGVAHGKRRFEEAAEYYRQSIEVLESQLHHNDSSDTAELRTDKAKLHANRAACLMMLTQITEAQRECQRSIEVDATYARAYLRLGRIQVLLGETAHAQANIDTAKQLMEGHGGEVKSSGMGSGDFKHALEHTESALALAPSCRKLQVQKARILLHQKEFGEIVAFCTSIVEKQLANHGKRSSPANRRGRNAKSLKDRTVEKIAFVGIDLGLLWATTLHYQNKVEDAVRILNVLEDVAPCSSNVFQLKRQWQEMKQLKHNGNARFKEGEYQEAVRFYSEAVQIDPQHFEYCAIIYCNRAAAQMGLERYHTAILDCNEALQRKPQYARALLRRARCYVALKMFHEAVKDFDSYLREQPNELPTEATADVRRERNEAKAAIAKAREEAKQREAAKKRAEREQRQRRSHRWEESSWNDSRFHENFRRGTSTSSGGNNNNNGSSYGSSRFPSSGAGGRASFMAPKTQRRTHYDVLGIEKAASGEQIKKAYRKLALVYHPDKAKTSTHADLFKEMTAAYNVWQFLRELIFSKARSCGGDVVELALALSGHEYFDANLINWALKIPRRGIAAEHDQADQDGLVGPYTPYDKTLIKLFVETEYTTAHAANSGAILVTSCGVDSALSDLIAYLQQRDQDERQDAGELDVHFPGSVREPGGCPPLQLATAGADSGLR
ncbi:DnaJ-like protein subfamily C member 7 [Phytophthora ramorum]|uniref:DnaJ-like protein subfamily C member 7 n=1 Tax=Phytophthora ramorum TaxID=164328 RepID=UPI0030A49A75|nr:DnaJ-like protein subfamily C member 7 [Phytophthora ramorum]